MGENERDYDKHIIRFLEKKGYICHHNDDIFRRKFFENLDVDVYGVRDIGGDYLEDIELIGVEVKVAKNKITDGIRKAHYYTKFVHRSYLATTVELSGFQRQELEDLGIGLLELKGKKVKEAIYPRPQSPIYEKTERFLQEKSDLRKCPICGFHYWGDSDNTFFETDNVNFFDITKSTIVCKDCLLNLNILPECFEDYDEDDEHCKKENCKWDYDCKRLTE